MGSLSLEERLSIVALGGSEVLARKKRILDPVQGAEFVVLVLQLLNVLGALMRAPCGPKLDLDEVVQVEV